MQDNKRIRSFEHKEQVIVQQHFWFTVTMLTVNGFLISNYKEPYSLYTLIWVTVLNLNAIFLIISRAASHADKIHFPEKITRIPQSERTYKEKARETIITIKATLRHIPFMILEFGNSLFYTLLVLGSYIIFITNCKFNMAF